LGKHTQIASNLLQRVFFENIGSAKLLMFLGAIRVAQDFSLRFAR
jgi:hypothetical protein